MRISIITVTLNAELTIKKCLESIHQQTYNDVEHIIIDGGSTDNTIDLINNFNKIKPSVLVSESDSGIYDALNKGILISSGVIVGLLHADDFFSKNIIVQNIVNAFEKLDASILYAKVAYVNRFNISKIKRVYSSNFFKPWMFRFGFSPAHPTFYVKKKLFIKYGNYKTNLDIAGDFELMLRFLYINKIKAHYVSEIWVIMRIGGLSTSGFNSVFKNNKDILLACKQNSFYTNNLFIYSKYLFKWWGLVFKRKIYISGN